MKFFSEILQERGNRLIVFIDELDRCKPSYAVHLLEQIKHYLCDDRITFVFSVNLLELQHTISHYYGMAFDSCRYLDRFFDIRIEIPPADKSRFFDDITLNSQYTLEKICKRIIENYNFELREITRFYRQVKTAIYEPTHGCNKWDFSFPDGQPKRLMLLCIVPIIIGLKIVNITLHDEFVNGKNAQPLIDIFDTEEFRDQFLCGLLNGDESFMDEENKKKVTKKQKIMDLYNAIFVKDYNGRMTSTSLGDFEFDGGSKGFAIRAASILSEYADYDI